MYKRGRQEKNIPKNLLRQNWNIALLPTAFTHIGYTNIGFCFSSRPSALGGETANALGYSGPSFFQLVRYQLRDPH